MMNAIAREKPLDKEMEEYDKRMTELIIIQGPTKEIRMLQTKHKKLQSERLKIIKRLDEIRRLKLRLDDKFHKLYEKEDPKAWEVMEDIHQLDKEVDRLRFRIHGN